METSKRDFLKGVVPVVTVGAIAGCSDSGSEGSGNPDTEEGSDPDSEGNQTADEDSPTPDEPEAVADVSNLQVEEPSVVQGSTLTFSFEVSNTTDEVQEVPLSVAIAETTENRTEALTGGQSETFEQSLDTDSISPGKYDLTVEHENSSVSTEVTIRGVTIDKIDVTQTTLQGLDLTPSFEISNPTSDTQELTATVTFDSQSTEITEALLAEETQQFNAVFTTDDLSPGSHTVTIEYSGTTVSRDVEIEGVDEAGLHGLIETQSDAELGQWTITGMTFDGETFYSSRETFGAETRRFQLKHPASFETGEQVEPPYAVDLLFKKGTPRDSPVFNNVPYGYTLSTELPVETDASVVGTYELPGAYRVEIQVLDSSGNPVTNSENVALRIGGSGFSEFQTDENGYIKHRRRDQTGVELVDDVTIEYLVDGDFEQRTSKEITVTEEQEFTLTVEDI